MTITLAPETETLLQERAARDGQDADTLANSLLKELLTESKERTEEEKEAAFDQAMLAAGLITSIPPPRDPSQAGRLRIEIQGEPVSATIIRERR